MILVKLLLFPSFLISFIAISQPMVNDENPIEIEDCECVNQIIAYHQEVYQPIVNSHGQSMSFFIGCTNQDGTICDAILQLCPEAPIEDTTPCQSLISADTTIQSN